MKFELAIACSKDGLYAGQLPNGSFTGIMGMLER